MSPAPRSLILDLLSTLVGRAAPVRALVTAAALFDIAENSLRVALARLLAEGLVERDERGLYRLGPGSQAVNAEVVSWRRMQERLRPWSGAWIGVHTGGLPRAGAGMRRRRERALRLLGFRSVATGLELRPDNLEGVEDARRRLRALGLEPAAAVFQLDGLSQTDDRRARGLWDAARGELPRAHRAARRRLESSESRLARLPEPAAMRESFLVGGAVLRQLVLDPLLPEAIVPAAERCALVEAMRRYDRAGRAAWSGWLGEAMREPDGYPADTRGLEAAASVLRAAGGGGR